MCLRGHSGIHKTSVNLYLEPGTKITQLVYVGSMLKLRDYDIHRLVDSPPPKVHLFGTRRNFIEVYFVCRKTSSSPCAIFPCVPPGDHVNQLLFSPSTSGQWVTISAIGTSQLQIRKPAHFFPFPVKRRLAQKNLPVTSPKSLSETIFGYAGFGRGKSREK